MTILDKLMEKKDLKNYIYFRIKRLKEQISLEMKRLPPKKREFAKIKMLARIEELNHLNELINLGTLKKESKIDFAKLGLDRK